MNIWVDADACPKPIITGDISLAAEVIAKGSQVITPGGRRTL